MFRRISMLLLAAMVSLSAHAAEEKKPLIFSTAPTASPQETIKLYQPLVDHLSRVIGHPIQIKPAANFIEYQIKMRLDEYDILFDGPHLVGWRMAKLGHVPLARFPGEIRIVVAANENNKRLRNLEDLAFNSAHVCAFASPNMLTMAFLKYFPNPARQPFMLRTSGFKGLEECLLSGRGDVAVLRDKMWKQFEGNKELRLISVPQHSYPERTFSASSRVPAELRAKLAEALLSPDTQKMAEELLKRFKKDKFIVADAREYKDLGLLLTPIWGFHEQ